MLLCFFALPLVAEQFGPYTYLASQDEVQIIGISTEFLNPSIEIPSEINGKPVTSIGDSALSGLRVLSITIPNSVISIGHHAFFRVQKTDTRHHSP